MPAFGAVALGDGDIPPLTPIFWLKSSVAATSDPAEDRADLDREQRSDSAIDYAIIDIGMFPDDDHLEPHDDLHDLTVAGPERLRAFAIEALRAAEALGHSFVSSVAFAEHAAKHHSSTATNSPLAKRNFYRPAPRAFPGTAPYRSRRRRAFLLSSADVERRADRHAVRNRSDRPAATQS